MKKGQGLSINVIIVAAIALLVLVILAIIFTGRIGIFTQEVDRCPDRNARCVLTQAECSGTYETVTRNYACDMSGDGDYTRDPEDGYCCLSV